MKLARLAFLLFLLVVSAMLTPEVYGGGKGVVRPNNGGQGTTQNQTDCDWYIYCSDGREACCYGDMSGCHGACEDYCGEACDIIIIEE